MIVASYFYNISQLMRFDMRKKLLILSRNNDIIAAGLLGRFRDMVLHKILKVVQFVVYFDQICL